VNTHPCAIPTCPKQVAQHLLMCLPHWSRVPKPLQQQVWRLWKRGPMAAYRDVRQRAIDVVVQAEVADRERNNHRGFWARTPNGSAIHVNGDPNMSDETLEMLGQVMDLAVEQYLNKDGAQ